jgi:type IV secretory pathway VirB10-like protein
MHPSGATPSQLDIIAEINERAARQHRGRRALRIGLLVGGAMLLGAALWWAMQGGAVRAPTTLLPAAAVLNETLRDTLAAVAHGAPSASASAVTGQAVPDVAAAPAQRALTASTPMEAAAAPPPEATAADKRARKARSDALQLQQERSRAQAQEREQREAEPAAQQASEPADAARPREAEQAPPPAQPVAEARPGVRELCAASGNIFSRNFCHARECRKPEHADDAICIRLREIEQQRPSGSQ